jgi:hypothetical protein
VAAYDRFLPDADESVAEHVLVAALPAETAAAVRRTELSGDRLLGFLGGLTDLPDRMAGAAVGGARTLGELLGPPLGFVVLADEPGGDLVSGVAARYSPFERHVEQVPPGEFPGFAEPGYVKALVAFSTEPQADGRTLLTAAVRVRATDDDTRSALRASWFLVAPALGLLLRRLLGLVGDEAEGSAQPPVDGSAA